MQYAFQKDATSKSIAVFLRDTGSSPVGQGKTALAYNTSGLQCYYTRGESGTPTAITLATQTSGGAWSSGGFVLKDNTNAPGFYRFDVPNAVLATGVDRAYLHFKGTGIYDECVGIDLLNDDPYSSAPTLTQIADALLTRDLSSLVNGSTKTLLGWMLSGGIPLEKAVISGGVLTVYENDATTVAFTVNLVGNPAITTSDRV